MLTSHLGMHFVKSLWYVILENHFGLLVWQVNSIIHIHLCDFGKSFGYVILTIHFGMWLTNHLAMSL